MVDDVMSAGVQEGGIATACGLIGLELQTTSSDRFDRHLGCCFCHRCGQSSVVLSGNAHHNLLCAGSSYLGLEDVTLLEDLLDNVFLLVSSELIVELAVGGSVEDTGGALSSGLLALVGVWRGSWSSRHILVGNKDFPAVDDLSERDRLVGLPVTDGLSGLDKDNVVVVVSLEVDLDLGCVSSHICGIGGSEWLVGDECRDWYLDWTVDEVVWWEGRKNAWSRQLKVVLKPHWTRDFPDFIASARIILAAS
jgi:hypothetical protein